MQIGQVIDYCLEYDEQYTKAEQHREGNVYRDPTQAEIDAFLG